MNFFKNIIDSVIKKQAELQERKEFLDEVERKAKPIRRAAYMQQMLKEVVEEGIEKAREDAEKRRVKKQDKLPEIGDPYKYLNQKGESK